MFLVAIALAALPMFSAYSLCNPADVKGPITIPIQNVLVTSPIVAAGSIRILDGCTFEVEGFSLQNAGPSKWFGGLGASLDGVTLSEDVINPNPSGGKQQFALRSVAGAAVSFRDFNQFRLFDTQSNTLIAVANVPANVLASGAPVASGTVPASSPTSSQRVSTSTRTSTSSQATANGDVSMVSSGVSWTLLMLFLGL